MKYELRIRGLHMEEVVLSSGDTAWMMMSVGLVTLMIPGLALFYWELAPDKIHPAVSELIGHIE